MNVRRRKSGGANGLRGVGLAVVAALAAAIVCSAAVPASAAGFVRDGLESTHVYSRWIYIEQGEYVICTTSNSHTGTDPAIHLWHSSNGEVASGFDYGSTPEALIAYANTGSDAYFRLLVRTEHNDSFNIGAHGKTDLNCSFSGIEPNFAELDIPVGGVLALTIPDPGDYFEVAMAPGGPEDTMLMALDVYGQLLQHEDYGGLRSMAGMDAPSGSFLSLVGVPHYRTLGKFTQTEGHVTLYGNDAANGDADGDGLGADLEALLMTCDSPTTHPYCSNIPNLQDSDHDGLRDDWEVFGEDRPYPQADNFFSYWGADPAQKDVFVEVDWLASVSSGVDNIPYAQSPFLTDGSSEVEAWFDRIEDPYLYGSDSELANPNGADGIQIHLDVGFDPDPAASTYASAFGDWGGGGPAHYAANGYHEQIYLQALHISESRKGRFHYAVAFDAYNGGAAQPGVPTFDFGYSPIASVGTPPSLEGTRHSGKVFAHELGHSLSLGHNHDSGDPNCNPIYISLMNYRYDYLEPQRFSAVDFSGTVNPSALRENSALTFDNFPVGPIQPDIYEDRFRAQAFPFHESFYEGEPISSSYTFDPLQYFTYPYWSVDWNQNGYFENSGSDNDPAVRSMMRIPSGCGYTLADESVSTSVASLQTPGDSTPQLAYLTGAMYATYLVGGQVRYRGALITQGLSDASCNGGVSGLDRFNDDCHLLYPEFGFDSSTAAPQDVVHSRVVRTLPSGVNFQGTLLFSLTRSNGDLVLCEASASYGTTTLNLTGCSQPIATYATASEIGYIYERVSGVNQKRLAVFATFSGGVVAYKSLTGPDPLDINDWSTTLLATTSSKPFLQSVDGSAISIAAWPPIEDFSAAPSEASTCFAMRERTNDDVEVYCTDLSESDLVWQRVADVHQGSAIPNVQTAGEPWLEFTRERLSSGERRHADPRVGRFALTFTTLDDPAQPNGNRHGQYMHSDWMGPRKNSNLLEYTPSGSNDWRFDFSTGLVPVADVAAGVSILDHSDIGATKALLWRFEGAANNFHDLRLQWAFDGAVDEDFQAYNDFRKMARDMCAELHPNEMDDFICD